MGVRSWGLGVRIKGMGETKQWHPVKGRDGVSLLLPAAWQLKLRGRSLPLCLLLIMANYKVSPPGLIPRQVRESPPNPHHNNSLQPQPLPLHPSLPSSENVCRTEAHIIVVQRGEVCEAPARRGLVLSFCGFNMN